MPMAWEQLLSSTRLGREADQGADKGRTDFERDFDRVLFSTPFRRLRGKTQVFPMPTNDHVHNRMTHSMEVASVGRTLGKRAGVEVLERHPALKERFHQSDFGDIVAAACLMHDLGNPPFGHAGEDAIATWFQQNRKGIGGLDEEQWLDLCHFEGNAQTFRTVARLHLYPDAGGMRLTYATLGAVAKYPQAATERKGRPGAQHKKFNFFQADAELFERVAGGLGLCEVDRRVWARHPLAWLVEAADDICYHVLDAEDGFALGLFSIDEMEAMFAPIVGGGGVGKGGTPLTEPRDRVGYLRAKAIGKLVDECVEAFSRAEEELLAGEGKVSLADRIPSQGALEEILERSRKKCYSASAVVKVELAGYRVIGDLLAMFVPAALAGKPNTYEKKVLKILPKEPMGSPYERVLQVTDFVAGMTDTYALRLYRELTGVELPG